MEPSGEFESLINDVKNLLGDSLISIKIFTSDGIILYSDSKQSPSEDFLVASFSAMAEISRSISAHLNLKEEPSILLLEEKSFILIRRVIRDVILMVNVKGSYEERSEVIAGILRRLSEFLH
jgi:predicted regulator of Ras-like GTPase activity (Roadblock/LC7/MglB family)